MFSPDPWMRGRGSFPHFHFCPHPKSFLSFGASTKPPSKFTVSFLLSQSKGCIFSASLSQEAHLQAAFPPFKSYQAPERKYSSSTYCLKRKPVFIYPNLKVPWTQHSGRQAANKEMKQALSAMCKTWKGKLHQ